MYGPIQISEIPKFNKTIPPAHNNNSGTGKNRTTEDSLSLLKVELEILLSMKIEDGLSFETAVQVIMVQTGNDYLFSFPPERFPVTCHRVSCVCLHDEGNMTYSYVYQESEDGDVEFAESSELDEDFLNFADSFADVMTQLRDIAPAHEEQKTTH